MKMFRGLFVLVFLAVLFCPAPFAEAQFGIPRVVIGGGGWSVSNGSFTIDGTVAQSCIGVAVNASGRTLSGFWYAYSLVPTGAGQSPVPDDFFAGPVYPNPCTGSDGKAAFEFHAARKCVVTLCVFSLLGDQILLTAERELSPGRYKITFPVMSLSSGMYLCEATASVSDDRSNAFFRSTLKLMVTR
jgi:hypothetical protein